MAHRLQQLKSQKWRNRRWATLILANLLFTFSFFLDIQILEGALTASRFVGFHLIDLNSALQVMLAHKHIINNLLIGTGTGITPYRAMLPQLGQLIAGRGVEVVLLQGARTPEELLYGDEFRAFADAHPGFRYLPCLSRALPQAGSPLAHADVRHGYVQDALAEFAPNAEGDIAYLCGNPNMVDACFEALKECGLPIPQIRREKYVSNK